LLYLISFLDRTNIGNAKIDGLQEDLKMTNNQYNNTLTIFFISYSIFEPLTQVLLKKYRPSIFLPVIMGKLQQMKIHRPMLSPTSSLGHMYDYNGSCARLCRSFDGKMVSVSFPTPSNNTLLYQEASPQLMMDVSLNALA
jgi:hypothetical protein